MGFLSLFLGWRKSRWISQRGVMMKDDTFDNDDDDDDDTLPRTPSTLPFSNFLPHLHPLSP